MSGNTLSISEGYCLFFVHQGGEEMGIRIERVLNNNAVVTKESDGKEYVLIGSGLAFQKKHGGYVSEEKVEKRYRLEGEQAQNNFSQLVSRISEDYFDIAEQTIELAKDIYNIELDSSILVSLADHIYNAVKRQGEGITLDNGLVWEIKQIYSKEFEIGKYVVKVVNEKFNTHFDGNEAAFISMHIIDNRSGKNPDESINQTIVLIKEIQQLLTYHFKTQIDEESLDYYRLITHLKFFVQRMAQKQTRDDHNDALYLMISKSYPASANAVKKIYSYLKNNYDYEMSKADQAYLVIHIANLFEKG